MTDQEIIERFEQGRAPGEAFHHADHVRVAFAYLGRYPLLQALERFSGALKRFALAHGKPGLYHETITWAYLFLIRERMARAGESLSWEEFVAQNSDLLVWKDGIVQRTYQKETLASELARQIFVLPDRCA
ncbi:MAG TPA: hypothetical protein VMT28_02370 [Terriglobales bacterium]|jgi:hypothetical protein|nr:hypothetical protein [Terriglobales bacterium]